MSEPKTCPSCGAALASDATRGVCPACLLEAGFATGGGPAGDEHVPTIQELAPKFPGLEIEALVGRGGMGVVFRARHKALDREVALKVLSASVAGDRAFADRFQREARALAKLQHPNIVAVHDFGTTDGLFWLVMEFVDGVNVREAMRAGHVGPKEALAIVPQICDALQYAHEHGVVHRDIKPENILLDKAGRVKVADFGLAKLMDRAVADASLTGAGQVMGTLHYMAPEQWEHPKDVDHRADIYSLGVVFYEMLTGELPVGRFAAPSTKSAVDARIDEIVMRTLEREREARYQQVSQVKTDVGVVTSSPAAAVASPSPAAVVANVPETVIAGLGPGLRRQLLVGALLAVLGAVFWAANDREIVWLVLPLAGLALMGIAVWYRIRGAAPAPSWAPKLEWIAGMLLAAAGLMAKLTAPTGDERPELAMLAIAVGWFMAAFGAPVIVADTRYSPAGRKAVVGFLAVAAVAAGIVSAVGLIRVSKFPAHEPAKVQAPATVADAPAERPAYAPAASDSAFVTNFISTSCIEDIDPQRRGIHDAWAKLAKAVAANDTDAVIELYRPEDREDLRTFARSEPMRIAFVNSSRGGLLGMPLWALDLAPAEFSNIRISQASATTLPVREGGFVVVRAKLSAGLVPATSARVFSFELTGRVHEDEAGKWTEWLFRKDGFVRPTAVSRDQAPAERPKYEPAPSDAAFPPEFALSASIAGLETPDLRALKAAWARMVQAAASRDVDAVIELYEPAARESLREMAKDPAQRLVFAEGSRQGTYGMPLMAFAQGADQVAEMRFRGGSVSLAGTFCSEAAVRGVIDTPRDKNNTYNRVEIFGVVHTDSLGQWIEWFFRRAWSGKQGG